MRNENSVKNEDYVREEKASLITAIPLPTLRIYRHKKIGIPFSKIGRSVFYKKSDIYDYMNSHRVETGPVGK